MTLTLSRRTPARLLIVSDLLSRHQVRQSSRSMFPGQIRLGKVLDLLTEQASQVVSGQFRTANSSQAIPYTNIIITLLFIFRSF